MATTIDLPVDRSASARLSSPAHAHSMSGVMTLKLFAAYDSARRLHRLIRPACSQACTGVKLEAGLRMTSLTSRASHSPQTTAKFKYQAQDVMMLTLTDARI